MKPFPTAAEIAMHAKIVPLTETLAVASQITAGDIAEIAALGYRTLINNRPDGEEPDQLSAAEARAAAEAAGIAYHYLPFTAGTLTEADIAAFDALLRAADGPVLAHCRSGTRCCLIWSAIQLKEGGSADALIAGGAAKGFEISALKRFA
ncbi:MAG TPA: TIGR01244 family sulfur transferase [Alphaproteobacteria bacterium]|nr:TIGR01244 family sulfur transferase [Alphaproteobacteria bacterium]